jgi:hypothetical protein
MTYVETWESIVHNYLQAERYLDDEKAIRIDPAVQVEQWFSDELTAETRLDTGKWE